VSQQNRIPVAKLTLALAAGFGVIAAIVVVVLLLSKQGLDNVHDKSAESSSGHITPVEHVEGEGGVVVAEMTSDSAQPATAPKAESSDTQTDSAQPATEPQASDTQTDSTQPVTEPVADTQTAQPAAEPQAQLDGATLYLSRGCVACHGVDANTPIMPSYPKLAGQNKDYLVAQMKDIKSGARNNGQTATMKPILSIVSEAEMAAIAGWIASQSTSTTSGTPASNGAALYQSKACFTCHGADAKTPIMPNYPKLAGQNQTYVVAQIKDIKSGARNNGQTAAMKALVSTVSDADMEAIASYLASLK